MESANLNVTWDLTSIIDEGKDKVYIFGYDIDGRIIRAVLTLEHSRVLRDRLSVMLNDVNLEKRIRESRELRKLNDWSGLVR